MNRSCEIKCEGKTATVLLYDVIGEDPFFGGGVSAKAVREQLDEAGKIDTINLHINSPGGSVFEGIAMHSVFARHSARVNVTIDGVAASIASVVAMAGDEIIMPRGSMMMIHRPWAQAMGTSDEMRDQANVLDKVEMQLTELYSNRTGVEAGEITRMLAAETWMTETEAVEAGFATAIEGEALKIAALWNLSERWPSAPEAVKTPSQSIRHKLIDSRMRAGMAIPDMLLDPGDSRR